MSTTHLHTKTTTIGPPQPYNQSAVGGAFPGEGGAIGGMDVTGQGPSSTSAIDQLQQPPIRYREYYCTYTIANCPTVPLWVGDSCFEKIIMSHIMTTLFQSQAWTMMLLGWLLIFIFIWWFKTEHYVFMPAKMPQCLDIVPGTRLRIPR